jgi:acetoin utilization deacetylase AcuC-like enzyme
MDELILFYPTGHQEHFQGGHPERPERVEVIWKALQIAEWWGQVAQVYPVEVSEKVLKAVHTPAYLNLLELSCRRGGHLDADTYTTPQSWDLAHKSAGGAIAVAEAVWQRKWRRGFALCRPPGHHAMRGQGMGFCLLNNIALAAEHLIQNYSVKKLAIIDLDLHHGNGTQDVFWKRNDIFYFSTHQSPFYPGSGWLEEIGEDEGLGFTANFPLPPGAGDMAFQTVMDALILPLLDRYMPEMLLVSYGYDTHWLDPLGQLLLTADGYARLLSRLAAWSDAHCQGRLAIILEGGYDLEAAEGCTLAVTNAMLGLEWSDPIGPAPYQESEGWKGMVRRAKEMWST